VPIRTKDTGLSTVPPTDLPTDLPTWAWLWLPPAVLAVELGFRMINEPLYRQLWQSELGPVETGTVVVLLPGILAGVMALA
jgi:hypothetical protein